MQETPQQYIQRMLGYVESKDPLQIQSSTPRKLASAIRRLSPGALRRQPAPGKWSIAEILAHMADAELVGGWRMRLILGQNGVSLQPFDQDAWARTFRYRDRNAKASLEMFSALRKSNLALLRSMPKNLWENYGMHQERGKETIAHIVRMFAGHDLNHLRQVESMAKQPRKRRAA
jgi:uncharacterized damage-inducible protein DinB